MHNRRICGEFLGIASAVEGLRLKGHPPPPIWPALLDDDPIAALGRQLAEAIDLGFRVPMQLKGEMAGQFEWM
ncbi:MAG: hypothetical protein ACYCSP_15680 [Acidobacteriaceae bacterium]